MRANNQKTTTQSIQVQNTLNKNETTIIKLCTNLYQRRPNGNKGWEEGCVCCLHPDMQNMSSSMSECSTHIYEIPFSHHSQQAKTKGVRARLRQLENDLMYQEDICFKTTQVQCALPRPQFWTKIAEDNSTRKVQSACFHWAGFKRAFHYGGDLLKRWDHLMVSASSKMPLNQRIVSLKSIIAKRRVIYMDVFHHKHSC
jgi:hypothetical protein